MDAINGLLLAAALVANGGFEEESKAWSLGKKIYSVVSGAGKSGGAGLVWENRDPGFYSFTAQRIALEPGCSYSFSGWVKDEGVANPKITKIKPTNISIEWYDDAGKFLATIGARPVVDNQELEHGWMKFAGVTPAMPANLGQAKLICCAFPGSTGRAVFDALEVVQLKAEPIQSVVSSAYRDTADSGKVSFVAKCILNSQRDPAASVSARFRFVGAGGRIEVSSPVSPNGLARAEVDVAALAYGTHPVEVELKRRDGSVIATREMEFSRVDGLPKRKVCFDEFGRTLVDGKPFFPIGLYSSRREVAYLDTYCEGPFNCILPYALTADPKELDPYHEKGLKVIVGVSDYSGIRGSRLKDRFDERSLAVRYIRALKNHPALLAWYLADELPPAKTANLRERNRIFRAEDPDHPTFVVFDRPERPSEFVEGYDIIGMDPYPIGNNGRPERLRTASTFPEAAKAGMYGFKALWQVPQAFDWSWHRPWAAKDFGAHMPTLAELRNMNWQAIASGANGLVGWWFSGMVRNYKEAGKTAEFDEAWGNVKTAYAEVAEKVPLLLSVEPAPKVTKLPPDISARTWRKDGVLWMLAVNRTYNAVSGSVGLSDGRSVEVSLEGLGWRFIELPERAR